jgi:hypothetical protein
MTMGSCEGGGARPSPFTLLTITCKVAVCSPAEWANTYTRPISSLPIYGTVCTGTLWYKAQISARQKCVRKYLMEQIDRHGGAVFLLKQNHQQFLFLFGMIF